MSVLEITPGYPLEWPDGRHRSLERKPALFRHSGKPITLPGARDRLEEQLSAMTRNGQAWRTTEVILSCNIRFKRSGARDLNVSRREPADPGAALYFDLDGQPHVLACDRWDTVEGNIAAIAAHIDALRGQERWGVADMRQAFAGHIALPRPSPWWEVLNIAASASADEINAAYRVAAKTMHPDTGGDRAAWDRLSAAYEEAKRAHP